MFMKSAHIPVTDLSCVGEARRAGLRLAANLGMDEVKIGELGILITEAARNAVVHGGGGQIVISPVPLQSGVTRIDVLALDKGPGIKNVGQAFQDGYSTAGTPGTGMGAIRRMAGVVDLFSNPHGTALLAGVIPREPPSVVRNKVEISGLAVAIPGEQVCGDDIAWEQTPERTIIIAVDGLGHGIGAADAAAEAVRVFHAHAKESPAAILSRIHDALKKTRGASAAIAEIQPLAGLLTYAGVGNISGVVASKVMGRNLISHNGTLGHTMFRIQEFKVEWPHDGILVMHSDGLLTRWDLSQYPGLTNRNPSVIAGVLFRDFRRQRDDSSVVVAKGSL
jgi:anti-sigma regulatory factor (Ser/Thr protein kinase)